MVLLIYFLIDDENTSASSGTINVNCPCIPPPGGIDASVTVNSNMSYSSTTVGACNDCSLRSSNDRVLEVNITCAGLYTFSTCGGATWDTYLYLTSNPCSGIIALNDDNCGLQSSITTNLAVGTYYLAIEGWSASSQGSFTVDITKTCDLVVSLDVDVKNCGYNVSCNGSSDGAIAVIDNGCVPQGQTVVFINEIHYDNSGADAGEAIEIAGTEGVSLSGWSLKLYNGSNGTVYNTRNLSGVIPNAGNGFGFVAEFISGIQNGAPDAIALVDNQGNVIQFLSYEGTVTATNGPAQGMTSTNIGASESSSTAVGFSLQLQGTGSSYGDFSWASAQSNTFGSVNNGQTFNAGSGSQGQTVVFINEIHYDNSGADAGEAIEIAGTAGLNISGWTLKLYNGSNGTVYNTRNLSGAIPNAGNGFGFVAEFISGIQNGSPDAIALVDNQGNVIQFLSYEGTVTATNGPAQGMTSTNIGVSESSSTAVGFSLQLQGTGSSYGDFSWASAQSNTFGSVNNGQTFNAVSGSGPTYAWSNGATTSSISGLSAGTYSVVVTDQFGCTATTSVTLTEPDALVVDAGSDQTVYYGYTPMSCADLAGSANGGCPAYNYSWSNGAAGNTQTVCPTASTDYTLTAVDQNGCTASDVVSVCVIDVRCYAGNSGNQKVEMCHIPPGNPGNAHTICINASAVPAHLAHGCLLGDCSEANDCNVSAKLLNGDEENAGSFNNSLIFMHVAPNPFESEFSIQMTVPEKGEYSIDLLNATGQTVLNVYSGNLESNKTNNFSINAEELGEGIYFLRASNYHGLIELSKIIKL